MSLTAKDVAEIMRLLEESSFDELSLESGDLKLRLRRGAAGGFEAADEAAAPSTASRSPSPSGRGSSSAGSSPAGGSPRAAGDGAQSATPSDPSLADVPSPLLGVFYRAPKPGEPPFVEVGAKVEEDTVVGIIEVMKLMNSVRAGVKGEVVEIIGQNGVLVEYGETLVRVRRDG